MRLNTLIASAALTVFGACGGGERTILDQGPRFPDAEGVATEVTLERIEIDGDESYAIGENVESFTTRSHEVTPLLTWKGKYVHIGLTDDNDVAWIAGIGTVIEEKGDEPYTLYTGVFEEQDPETDRAVFEDGTTLAVAKGVAMPEPGEAIVTLDPTRHEITNIENP